MTTWTVFNAGSPGLANETDGPIALSTGFQINDGGTYWCTGIEFFASSVAPTGVVATLYERNTDESPGATPGATLATKAAPGAITPGVRNQILFDTPVPVTAALFPNGMYATYTTANRYTATGGYFSGGSDVSGPITAYQTGTVGFNGRFRVAGPPTDATNSYPQLTSGGGGYWVSPIITDEDPSGAEDVVEIDAGPRGARVGGSPAVTVSDVIVADGGPRGAQAGGSPAVTVVDHVVADGGPRGARAGGSPAQTVSDVILADGGPRGARAGGSPATASEVLPVDVTDIDRPIGARAGGSGAFTIISNGPTLDDGAVWPMLVQVLACLEEAADQVEAPPLYRSIRMGDSAQANISPSEDECCSGLAWVRPVSIAPTNAFPTPESAYTNCPPGELAVVVEIGMIRCAPIMAPGSDDAFLVPTAAQHAQTAFRVMNDAAALRRAACCMIGRGYLVMIGSWSPLPLEANCVGGSMQITVAAPFCERTC